MKIKNPYQELVRNTLRKTALLILLFSLSQSFAQTETHIRKKMEIEGGIAPKSVVSSNNGLFSAQNMMYRHTITFYDAGGTQVHKLSDAINLRDYGFDNYPNEKSQGAPVEGVFTKDGNYLWVSNYLFTSSAFTNPGCDDCVGKGYDPSFIYKINTKTFAIENVIEVGSVPKFIAISPQENWLIVSNWVSSDVSIIDLHTEKEVKRVTVGTHPRGIAITADDQLAYITIMGGAKLVEINLATYATETIEKVGKSPRSVILADHDSTLYISLNSSHEILKYNRFSKSRIYCSTQSSPRSMTISPNEKWLYVVNYLANSFTKINTDSMKIDAIIETSSKPIGICGNWENAEIWVACYSGKIEIFKDFKLEKELTPKTFFEMELPYFNFETLAQRKQTSDVDSVQNEIIEPIETSETKTVVNEFKTITANRNHVKPNAIKATTTITTTSTECQFNLIVGAFSIKENAATKCQQMLAKNYHAQLIDGEKLTYVAIGCYTTREEAEKGKIELIKAEPQEKSAWIRMR